MRGLCFIYNFEDWSLRMQFFYSESLQYFMNFHDYQWFENCFFFVT